MRASTAYFVGAGSIIAAIAIGLGGGIVAGNIMHPIAPKQGPDSSKIGAAAATTNAPSERVQYLTGSQTFGSVIAPPAQAEGGAGSQSAKPETPATQANAEPPAPSQAAASEAPKPAPASPPQVAKPAEQQAKTEPASSPDNAYAKARDSDVKRAASERRHAERRARWAERRHYDSRDVRGYDSRDARAMREHPNWDDVARNVREDADSREVESRPRSGFPQIRLFGSDDDD